MKTKLSPLVTGLLLAAAFPGSLSAEIGLSDVIGAAMVVRDTVRGSTTITPACAISQYNRRVRYDDGFGGHWYVHQRLRRSVVTATYFYETSVDNTSMVMLGPWRTNNTVPFLITELERLNYICRGELVYFPGHFSVWHRTVDFKIFVWIQNVTMTGLVPDEGPWTLWLKTTGSPVQNNCEKPVTAKNWLYWAKVDGLISSGGVTTTLGNPSCIVAWPVGIQERGY